MKIAKDIAEALYDGTFHGDAPSSGDKEAEVAYFGPIIAAKLEPVRDNLSNVRHDLAAVLSGLHNADVSVQDMKDRTRESLERVRNTLALFEEEPLDP